MIQPEIIIDRWCASYFDNFYDDTSEEKTTVNRKKQIPFENFIEKINSSKPIYNDILPLNCRYFKDIGDYKLFIIEEPPQMRTIFLDYDMSWDVERLKASGDLKKFGYEKWFKENKNPYKFYLAFPYIIYMILLDAKNDFIRLKVFSRVTPLSSFGDYVCKLPLTNIDINQSVCMGSFTVNKTPDNQTLSISRVITQFWKNIFNKDYIYNVQDYKNIPYVCDYLTWQYYSQKDPMFIYNVEWLPWKNRVMAEITQTEKDYHYGEEDNTLQNLINKIFYKVTVTDKIDKTTKLILYDNTVDSINIEGMPIFVNDSFMLRDKKYFVRSFMSAQRSSVVSYIKLQDSDDNIREYKLTSLFESKLKEAIMKERFIQKTILPNGDVIKQGTIIKTKSVYGGNSYNKISYMRYGLDGKVEARIKSSLISLEDMKNVEVIDIENIKINGIKLQKDKQYNLLYNHTNYYNESNAPIKVIRKCIISDINVNSNGEILVSLVDHDGMKRSSISLEELKHKLIDPRKLKSKSSICRMGTGIIFNPSLKIYNDAPNDFIISNGNIHVDIPSYDDCMEVVLKDKDHLFIESFDMDLSFKVGDRVVSSNWETPVEMFKVKTVTGFKTIGDSSLTIILDDQYGNTTEHTYLYRNATNFIVNVGTLRHIEKEYNGMTSGTKIKANKAQISNFPMKDTNIIIGFLTDTGGNIPLVLCSNGATLWADELEENFNLISMNDKKWKTLKHAPIIDQQRFKFQTGDMSTIPYDQNIYIQNLITMQNTADRLICHYLTGPNAQFPRCSGYFTSERKSLVKRIGFLTPRYSQAQLETQRFVKAYPNFHGMYSTNPYLNMKYYVDERRITNVSDLPV